GGDLGVRVQQPEPARRVQVLVVDVARQRGRDPLDDVPHERREALEQVVLVVGDRGTRRGAVARGGGAGGSGRDRAVRTRDRAVRTRDRTVRARGQRAHRGGARPAVAAGRGGRGPAPRAGGGAGGRDGAGVGA